MLLKMNNLVYMKLHTSRMEYPEGVPLERVTLDWHVIGNSINCCSIMKYLAAFFRRVSVVVVAGVFHLS